MQFLKRMIIISAGIMTAIACTGCTAFVAEDYPVAHYSNAAPIEMTHAMRVAVPAPLGTPLPVRQTVKTVPHLDARARMEAAKNTLVEFGVDIPPSYEADYDLSKGGPAFGFVSSFNEIGAPETLLSGYRSDALATEDWSGAPALRALRGQLGAQRLSFGTLGQERYDAQFSFSAPSQTTGLGFDIGIVPSLSYAEEGNFQTRRIGAEFRLGQDIDQRGSDADLPSWYFFAGADGEAVIFNNGTASGGLGFVNGLQLRDQVTVGDIQAGLNVRRYGTNFAFNYIRREVEYEINGDSLQRDEDFGGITLTWKR
jgi:hypothetical protein